MHRGGTYVNMEGPQFSTLAESKLYRSWGMDVIGMTNLQEAKLAREAEICYSTLALVTDYDCWHPDHDSVTVDLIVANLLQNAKTARARYRRGGRPDQRVEGVCMQGRPRDGYNYPPRKRSRVDETRTSAHCWEVPQIECLVGLNRVLGGVKQHLTTVTAKHVGDRDR